MGLTAVGLDVVTSPAAHDSLLQGEPLPDAPRPLIEREVAVIAFGYKDDPLVRLAHALGVEASVTSQTFTDAATYLVEQLATHLVPGHADSPQPTTFAVTIPSPYDAPQRESTRLMQEVTRVGLNDAGIMEQRRQLSDHINALKLSRPELHDYLHDFYGNLLQVVEAQLGPDVTAFIMDKPLDPQEDDGGRVWTLIGAAAAKAVLKYPLPRDGFPPRLRAERIIALRRLYDMKDRSPYISYQMRETDGDSTIEDYLESFETARSLAVKGRLVDAIELVRDAMLGADFLVRNGFRLTDLKGDNIRRDPQTENGLLFDFDSLVTESYWVPRNGYVSPLNRRPPERQESGAKYDGGTIDELEMSYELGYTIGQIMGIVTEVQNRAAQAGAKPDRLNITLLENLRAQMTTTDPNGRPTLAIAAEQLDQWLQATRATKETRIGPVGSLVRQLMRRPRA